MGVDFPRPGAYISNVRSFVRSFVDIQMKPTIITVTHTRGHPHHLLERVGPPRTVEIASDGDIESRRDASNFIG